MVSWTAVAVVAAAFAVRFTPEYSLRSSYFLTSTAFILTAWATIFTYRCILYPTYLTPLKHIPTPQNRTLLFGHTGTLALRFPIQLVRKWVKTVPHNGMIRFYVIGNQERVLLISPKAISDLLVNKIYDFERPELARIQLGAATGVGLLLAEGDVHKAQRKSLMPSFSYRHIKDLYPVFWSKAVQMTNEIEKGVKLGNGEDTITVSKWSSRAMLDIIGLAGMDDDFNSIKNPDNELARRYASMNGEVSLSQRIIASLCIFFIGFRWYFYIPNPQTKVFLGAVEYVRQVAHKHVYEKRVRIQQQQQNGEAEDGKSSAIDILSVAMRSGSFTDNNLVDQMMTFLAAGHDTTSSAFQWSIYALSKHPEVQTRLREEIRENLPVIPFDDLDDTKNLNDIKDKFSSLFAAVDNNNNHSLPYLWAFTSEVLRYHPSVPVTSRKAIRDTTLDGQFIAKGTHVLISPEVTNRDEELWGEDAATFKPERWLNVDASNNNSITYNNNGGATSNYANLTFIHGPRSCIGQGFARAELAIFVAVFVYRFEFELSDPDKELKITGQITQTPLDGVVVKVRNVD